MAKADLIVWPEADLLFYSIRKGTKNLKRQVMGQLQKPLLFGGLTVENPGKEDRKFSIRRIFSMPKATSRALTIKPIYSPLVNTFLWATFSLDL